MEINESKLAFYNFEINNLNFKFRLKMFIGFSGGVFRVLGGVPDFLGVLGCSWKYYMPYFPEMYKLTRHLLSWLLIPSWKNWGLLLWEIVWNWEITAQNRKKSVVMRMKGKEIFKKLRAPIGASSQSKSKCQTIKDMAMTKSQQMRFEFVWKHWSGRRFKQKKAKHAGWGRVWNATYNSKGNGTYTKLACSHFSRLGPIYMSMFELAESQTLQSLLVHVLSRDPFC